MNRETVCIALFVLIATASAMTCLAQAQQPAQLPDPALAAQELDRAVAAVEADREQHTVWVLCVASFNRTVERLAAVEGQYAAAQDEIARLSAALAVYTGPQVTTDEVTWE